MWVYNYYDIDSRLPSCMKAASSLSYISRGCNNRTDHDEGITAIGS